MACKNNPRPLRHLGRVGNHLPVSLVPHAHTGRALLPGHHRPCNPHKPSSCNHLSHQRDHHAHRYLTIGWGKVCGGTATALYPLSHHHSHCPRHHNHHHPHNHLKHNHPHHTTQHIDPVAIFTRSGMATPFLCVRFASIPHPHSSLSSLILHLSCSLFRFACEKMQKNGYKSLPFQKYSPFLQC